MQQQQQQHDPYGSNMTAAGVRNVSCNILPLTLLLLCTSLPRAVSLQVPAADNYYAALNSAVFSDGSFVFVPKGVKSPMELSTYFRINASETGQVRLALC
jgi:hypothetical protein